MNVWSKLAGPMSLKLAQLSWATCCCRSIPGPEACTTGGISLHPLLQQVNAVNSQFMVHEPMASSMVWPS